MSIILETKSTSIEKFGKVTGYFFAYVLFSMIVYFILKTIGKTPNGWSFLDCMMIITGPAVIAGMFLRHYLK
jgi:hypothetical protein